MPVSRKRGGKKQHNNRIQKRKKEMEKGHWELEMLKRKIYEEAKQRYLEQLNKPTELKITTDDGHNNS